MLMNAKSFYNVLAILLGYGLIIASFIIFGESLDTNIKILDIVVSCFIFTQFTQFSLFPMINFSDSAHKEVGMMGMHWVTLIFTSILAISLMIAGIIWKLSFTLQLIGQLCILFLLLIGRYTTLHTGEKIREIHQKEQVSLFGKKQLKEAMNDFIDKLPCIQDIDMAAKRRLISVHEEIRFITPSANAEALKYDDQFIQTLHEIEVLARDCKLNQNKISEKIDQLERILSRRKNIYN